MFGLRRNFFVLILVIVYIEALETGKIRNTIQKMSLPEVRQYVQTLAHHSSQNAQKAYHDARNYMTRVRTNIGQEGGLRQSLGLHPRPRPRIGTRVYPRGQRPQNTPGDGNVNPTAQINEYYRRGHVNE